MNVSGFETDAILTFSTKRSSLLAALVLLVIVASAPTFAVLLNLQWELKSERKAQARRTSMQQTALVGASLDGLLQGYGQLMAGVALGVRSMPAGASCTPILDGTRAMAPGLALLAVLRADGALLCGSGVDAANGEDLPTLLSGMGAPGGFVVGRYARLPSPANSVLTLALGSSPAGGGDQLIILAGLSLRSLQSALATTHQPADGRALIADRNGIVLARKPDTLGGVGEPIKGQLQAAFSGGSGDGTMNYDGDDGQRRIAAYMTSADKGLFISSSFNVADLSSGLDQATERGTLLITVGLAVSLLLALLVGQRYLRAPAAILLEAARRWGGGDLTARAAISPSAGAEFAGMARAFNDMAGTLQQQRSELQSMNDALERRVAERTRALVESNNRLQVEIAEREMTEASLRQAQKLQVVGQLAGGIAHDFNNLLTAILGSLELLQSYNPNADEKQCRLFRTATDAVQHGSRLTSQMLAFSRKQPLLAVSVNVASTIDNLASLLSSTLGAAIQIDLRMQEGLWPANVDLNQFEAAMLNLALNARDAMPRGGRLTITAANVTLPDGSPWADLPDGEYVCVRLADTGTGMPADVLGRVFEPFFTTKETGKGAGLGLSQVHGSVRQSGGDIRIESRFGAGTVVTLMLPRSLNTPIMASPREGGTSSPALTPDQVVLLVDDDDNVRDVTEAMLLDNGYTVTTAADGAGALSILEQDTGSIALVIADYAMPGMTGLDLLARIRARRPDIALLLATGYADYGELVGDDLPLDHIVRKPFRSNELLARMQMVYARQNSAAEAHLTH